MSTPPPPQTASCDVRGRVEGGVISTDLLNLSADALHVVVHGAVGDVLAILGEYSLL